MNRVSSRLGVIATMAALGALALSTAGISTAAAQSFGQDGTIHACFKAKGKNRGALRVVSTAGGCRKLRGWRPVSWTANASSGANGQNGSQGAGGSHGDLGQVGPQGIAGPEGKEGAQGLPGQVEKSLIETVQTQTTQIGNLTKQVTDLSGEVLDLENNVTDLTGELLDLEGTVGETCTQLNAVTKQADDIVTGVTGVTLNNPLQLIGALVTFPSLPTALGTFECE